MSTSVGGPVPKLPEAAEVGKRLLVACVRAPFDQSSRAEVEAALEDGPDWIWVFNTAHVNRVFPFLYFGLRPFPERVPPNVRGFLEADHRKVVRRNGALLGVARAVTEALRSADVPGMVMRGVSFLETIYGGTLGLRDFGDIDLLVRRGDLERTKKCLRDLGLGPSPGALDDRYYERHHLHLSWQREQGQAVIELHWSLDHKYTSYAIDTGAVFDRASWHDLPNSELLLMDPGDELIAACVHAFKHDPLVRHYLGHLAHASPAFPDRHLAHLADLTGLVSRGGGRDWNTVVSRCREWRAGEAVWALLTQAKDVLGTEVPGEVLSELRPPAASWLERRVADAAHALMRSTAPVTRPKAIAARLLRYRHGLVFDPVRLVDLSGYLFPSIERAKLTWGCRTSTWAVVRIACHLVRSGLSLARNLVDALYYGAKRRLRGRARKPYHPPLQPGVG